jgi:glycosyltransferase involved in cell wall biosynthesis
MSALSVIVPATDDPATLARCLEAIAASARAPDEVVVVREPARCGPARARNLGARRASGDLLVFVDADVLVHADALARMERAFLADPSLTALFGSYDAAPAAPGVVSRFRNLLHHHVHHESAGPATTFWTGLGAVRREAFVAVGGFDEVRHPRAMEDVDLGLRLVDAGGRIHLVPEVQGTHLKRWTLVGMVRTDLMDRGIPWIGLILRRGAGSRALNLGRRHRASALASVALLAGLAARRPAASLGALAALVALNHDFYRLLARHGGARFAGAGVALHAVHHLTGVASVPAGVLAHLAGRRRGGEPGA